MEEPYSPELTPEAVHAILTTRPGRDLATLWAAAGVSKAWRAAALNPRLWPERLSPLSLLTWPGGVEKLTDKSLAVLISRVCGADLDGKQRDERNTRELVSLNLGGALYRTLEAQQVTLRGVLAALGGPATTPARGCCAASWKT